MCNVLHSIAIKYKINKCVYMYRKLKIIYVKSDMFNSVYAFACLNEWRTTQREYKIQNYYYKLFDINEPFVLPSKFTAVTHLALVIYSRVIFCRCCNVIN